MAHLDNSTGGVAQLRDAKCAILLYSQSHGCVDNLQTFYWFFWLNAFESAISADQNREYKYNCDGEKNAVLTNVFIGAASILNSDMRCEKRY